MGGLLSTRKAEDSQESMPLKDKIKKGTIK